MTVSLFPFTLPTQGHHFRYPRPYGSADVLWLSELLRRARDEERMVALFCHNPERIERLQAMLRWMIPESDIAILPDWETMPYDQFSPHKELVASRVKTLDQLTSKRCNGVLISLVSAMTRFNDRQYFLSRHFDIHRGDIINRDQFVHRLVNSGYQHVSQVISPGEWALRGSIIDLFPMGTVAPCRIEWNDEHIESLRLFDAETQRTIHPMTSLVLLPAREFPFDEEAINRFRRRFRERFTINPTKSPLYTSVTQGSLFAGAEYYLPLWAEKTSTLFDYLPQETICVIEGDWQTALTPFWRQVEEAYAMHSTNPERPLLPTNEVFVPPSEFMERLSSFARITLMPSVDINDINTSTPTLPLPDALNNKQHDRHRFEGIQQWQEEQKSPVILFAETAGRRNVLEDLLKQTRIPYQVTSVEKVLQDIYTPSAVLKDSQTATNTLSNTRVWLVEALLEQGFVLQRPNFSPWIWIAEEDLYAEAKTRGQSRRHLRRMGRYEQHVEQWIRDLSELTIGDLVVHQQYGIGRYQGLIHLDFGEGQGEFIQLEYAKAEKLYVPVTQLHLIGRYSASHHETVHLHTLGSREWEKARQKAEKQVRDTAAELLSLYALRNTQSALSMSVSSWVLDLFATGFDFDLTLDQEASIEAVLSDMAGHTMEVTPPPSLPSTSSNASNHNDTKAFNPMRCAPMDRLICGDVGFGKTEVALRAAFVAVANGYQVAILCPTTLLAEQHTSTFQDRFERFRKSIRDIKKTQDTLSEIEDLQHKTFHISGLSRFRSTVEQKDILNKLKNGQTDIVIGTHRLLQKDVCFQRLGLVVVDEEHRFGVRHKEALKTLRAKAHVLTMTATPIPRTLSLSLEGLRDFSVMTTPPDRRLSIKTIMNAFHDGVVREAILREFRRGGQVFFLYNEVATIGIMEKRLQSIVPEARIVIAHGQMRENELERVMRDFRHQRYNLLLCSTIIENGIDIPNANTILIHRANHFGIAQLHQLRGRVGRSHHQAYCYLLIDRLERLSQSATQRLEAICASEELGAGFYLAMHDLEIRGAGDFLGEKQSGAITQIGFDLYSQMLQRAVQGLQKGVDVDLDKPFHHPEEINLHAPALLPEDYCFDVHERLKLYKRLASCNHLDEVTDMRTEIVDRFGLKRDGTLPIPVETLLAVHQLRLLARPLEIYKIDTTANQLQFFFNQNTPVEPQTILRLLRTHSHWTMKNANRLLVQSPSVKPSERMAQIIHVLKQLGAVIPNTLGLSLMDVK